MTIAEAQEKCKGALGKIPRDMLIIAVLVLASSASFGLGFLAGRDVGQGSEVSLLTVEAATGQYVASKTGTKYYPLDCGGASRISEANKIWFASANVAEIAGYSLATNCKGF